MKRYHTYKETYIGLGRCHTNMRKSELSPYNPNQRQMLLNTSVDPALRKRIPGFADHPVY